MTPKENLLRAIRYENPQWVPRGNEPVMRGIAYAGNYRFECWTDSWGTRWETQRSDMTPFPKGNPLSDLSLLDDYTPPDPDELFVLTDADRALLDAADRDEYLLFGQQTYFLFERAWALTGLEAFMVALHTDRPRVRRLVGMITDYNRRIFELYMEAGCDGVGFSEDLGSQRALFLSPKLWRELLLPEYRRAFEPVKRAGGLVNFHSCGCVEEIVPDLVDLGVDVLNPVQARANDLGRVKAAAAGRMALQGAIDTQHVLMRGTPADVRAEVARVIEILKPGGGYICGPDQWMPFPEENLSALWQAAEDLGRY